MEEIRALQKIFQDFDRELDSANESLEEERLSKGNDLEWKLVDVPF